MITTGSNGSRSCDFEKYDPYIEKIRSLFVPSLEPRIYNCLEIFVYGKNTGRFLGHQCLKRCLEMAAAWRNPVDTFYTKWTNEGSIENMLSYAIKHIIKNGLIDCFLNSIILNNRLDKVCQDLDGLGIERHFLRYFAVWNYVNEKDYWMGNDKEISMPEFQQSCNFIDHHSDLDVEIGSCIRDCRNDKTSRKSLKRRALDDSIENVRGNDNSLEDINDDGDCSRSRQRHPCFCEELRSNEKIGRKSFSQNFPCGSLNCWSDRRKDHCHDDHWRGKSLKLTISEASSTDSKCEPLKSLEISKMRLPCTLEDLIGKIMEADETLSRFCSMLRRKKVQASAINIFSRINEMLKKIDKKEVRRCKLHCEMFPGHLSFRMIKRESDGCRVLLTDRVIVDKIEAESSSASEESCAIETAKNAESENSTESDLTIYESAQTSPGDENIQTIPTSRAKDAVELKPLEGDVIMKKMTSPEGASSKANFSIQTSRDVRFIDHRCPCYGNPDHGLSQTRDGVQNNEKSKDSTDLRNERIANDPKDSRRVNFSKLPGGRSPENLECGCDMEYEAASKCLDREAEKTEESKNVPETKKQEGDVERLIIKEPLVSSAVDACEIQASLCNESFDVTVHAGDCSIKRKIEGLDVEESLMNPMKDATVDKQECLCNSSVNHETAKFIDRGSSAGCLGDSVQDISHSNLQNLKDSSLTPNIQKSEGRQVPKTQSCLTLCQSIVDCEKKQILHKDVACECSLECTCVNPETLQVEAALCVPKFSCVSIHDSAPAKPLVQPIEEPLDSPNYVPIKRSQGFFTLDEKMKSTDTEMQEEKKESEEPAPQDDRHEESSIPLKSTSTKVLLMSFEEGGMNFVKPEISDQKSLQSSKMNEARNKLPRGCPAVISARLARPKAQKINISIELCPESECSVEKNKTDESKNVVALSNVSKKNDPFGCVKSKVLPSSIGQPGCQVLDRGFASIHGSRVKEKRTKAEYSADRNCRVSSSSRPSEFKECLPPMEHVSSAINPSVYRNSTNSSTSSNEHSLGYERRVPKNYQAEEFPKVIRNNQFRERKDGGYGRFGRNGESSRSPKNFQPFPTSIINRHLCHAFSASSVDRMRHLIRTKLRRILLERDKSTNTPKTTLTTKKYRVSVPNGKTERSGFSKNNCRTIWESRSASNSMDTSRSSFVSEDRTGIRDRSKITRVLYSSALGSSALSSNAETIPQDFDRLKNTPRSIDRSRNFQTFPCNEPWKLDTMNYSRLAGGSDYVPRNEAFDSDDFLPSKEHCPRSSMAKMKKHCSSNIKDHKLFGESINCQVPDVYEKETRLSNIDDRESNVSRKKPDREFVGSSCMLDSTSRHINLYEFTRIEPSYDESLKTIFYAKDRGKLKTLYSSNIFEEKSNGKSFETKKKAHKGNILNDLRSRKNELKNSSSNTNTMNSRQKNFHYLDHDLRSKLYQYARLCKSVKYSLLKKFLPENFHQVSRTSISCGDRCKFGNS